MGIIKDMFKEKADVVAADIKALLKEHGEKVIGEVTLSQIYQGMRGITALVTKLRCWMRRMASGFAGIPYRNSGKSFPRYPAVPNPYPKDCFI